MEILWCGILLLAAPAEKQPESLRAKAEEWPAAYRTAVDDWRAAELERQQQRLEEKQDLIRQRRGNASTRAELSQAKAAIKTLRSKRVLEPVIYGSDLFGQTHSLDKDDVGRFTHDPQRFTYRVEQVLGPDSTRIQVIEHWRVGTTVGATGTLNPAAVQGLGAVIYHDEDRDGPHFILSGVPTDDWIDGAEVVLNDIYQCTGNTTYDTVGGGTRSVLAVQRIPEDATEPAEVDDAQKVPE